MNELETMARGLLALEEIYRHSEQQGIPALTPGACRECMTAAAASMQNRPQAQVDALFCRDMQQWRAELAEGKKIAREVLA